MKLQARKTQALPSDGSAATVAQSGAIRDLYAWVDSSRELRHGLEVLELSIDVRLFELMDDLETARAAVDDEQDNKRSPQG